MNASSGIHATRAPRPVPYHPPARIAPALARVLTMRAAATRCRLLSTASTSATMRVAWRSSPWPRRSRRCKSAQCSVWEGLNKCLLHFSDAQGESALSALLTVSVTYRHRKWWHIPVPREPLINQRCLRLTGWRRPVGNADPPAPAAPRATAASLQGHLTTQRTFFVAISRVRDRAELVSDDAAQF